MTASASLVAPRAGVSASADLIVDTGADLSVMPNHALSAPLAYATFGPGVTFVAAGASISTVMANGLSVEVDTEPHGGGHVSIATSSLAVAVHYLAVGSAPFVAFDGLLSMDLLDDFRADPVKDLATTRAYLAKRA
jgi:hypothetical protein